MKVDVTQVLKDYEGKDIAPAEGRKLTLRDVIVASLNIATPSKPMTAEMKNKAFQISTKLYASKEVDLTIDDRAFIKEWVLELQRPLVAGRVIEILEGQAKREK